MAVQIQFRNDTAQNWASANPILAVGEMGVETDNNTFKIGDGETAWSDLGYLALPGAGYEYSWTTEYSLPQSPGYANSTYTVEILARVGKAYTEGNYVRYYYDKVNNPDVWIEGEIVQVVFATAQDSVTILVTSQGPEAELFSPDNNTTINSELMLSSKSGTNGDGYSYELPEDMESSPGLNFTQIHYASIASFNGVYGKAFGRNLSFPESPYVRITFSNGDWVEGLLSASDVMADIWIEKWSGVTDLSVAASEILSVRLAARNITSNDILLGVNTILSIDPATIYPGYSFELYGNPNAYSVGDYVRFSIDDNNWIEGIAWSVGSVTPGIYASSINISVNKWNLSSTIAPSSSNIFVDYPYAQAKILGTPVAGYSGGPALATPLYSYQNPFPNLVNPINFSFGTTYSQPMEIGAYRVGDYVRLSYSEIPDYAISSFTPLVIPEMTQVWFEGTITSVVELGTQSSVLISIEDYNVPQEVIDNGGEDWAWWSIGLAGKPGPAGVAGEDGEDGDTNILQHISTSYNINSYQTYNGQSISDSVFGGKIDLFTITKTSSTSSIEIEVPLSSWLSATEESGV